MEANAVICTQVDSDHIVEHKVHRPKHSGRAFCRNWVENYARENGLSFPKCVNGIWRMHTLKKELV